MNNFIKTLHLPLSRSSIIKPEVTVVIGSVEEGNLVLAYSVCSKKDQFEKRRGKIIATNRFKNRFGYYGSSILPAIAWLMIKLKQINTNRPGTISNITFEDLREIPNILDKSKKMRFQKYVGSSE